MKVTLCEMPDARDGFAASWLAPAARYALGRLR